MLTNRSLKIVSLVPLLMYAIIFSTGWMLHALPVWLAATNICSAGTIILIVAGRRVFSPASALEKREMICVLAELIVGAVAGWFLLHWPLYSHLCYAQYAVFIFHTLVLSAAVMFAFFFRLKKLF